MLRYQNLAPIRDWRLPRSRSRLFLRLCRLKPSCVRAEELSWSHAGGARGHGEVDTFVAVPREKVGA